jgi:hypothetical protein
MYHSSRNQFQIFPNQKRPFFVPQVNLPCDRLCADLFKNLPARSPHVPLLPCQITKAINIFPLEFWGLGVWGKIHRVEPNLIFAHHICFRSILLGPWCQIYYNKLCIKTFNLFFLLFILLQKN